MARATVFFSNVNKSLIHAILLMGLAVATVGCNEGGDGTLYKGDNTDQQQDTGQDTTTPPPPPPTTGPTPPLPTPVTPHTIQLSYKVKEAVVVQGGGFYSWQGGVIVTDEDGNAVADGTEVRLNIVDTVIAQGDFGTLAESEVSGDRVSGNTLTDSDASFGDGVARDGLLLDSIYAIRNQAYRFVEPGDHVFLINADELDKDRTINEISGGTLIVDRDYTQDYPNTIYNGDNADGDRLGPTEYMVGVSALGAEISGEDGNGNLTTGKTVTKDGRATFRVTYPSSASVLNTGCDEVPEYDERSWPYGTPGTKGSARVYVVASVNNTVTTVDDQFCFIPVKGFSIETTEQVSGVPGQTIPISITVKDGGDTARVPYHTFEVFVTNGEGAQVTASRNGMTDREGKAEIDVVIGAGSTPDSTATLTITAEEGSAEVTVNINAAIN